MKYYLLERSLKRKDVGVAFGQTRYLLDLDFVPNIPRVDQLVSLPNWHGNLKNDKFPDFEPRIKFELSEKGKLTDLVDIPDVTANGMLISPKFRDLLERFNLMEHRFYDGVVKTGVFYREFFWFHPVCKDPDSFIDFDRSIFRDTISDSTFKLKSVHDTIEYAQKYDIITSMSKIFVKEPFKNLDLIYIPHFQFFNSFFISGPLMNAIKREKITGIEIKEQDVFGDL